MFNKEFNINLLLCKLYLNIKQNTSFYIVCHFLSVFNIYIRFKIKNPKYIDIYFIFQVRKSKYNNVTQKITDNIV